MGSHCFGAVINQGENRGGCSQCFGAVLDPSCCLVSLCNKWYHLCSLLRLSGLKACPISSSRLCIFEEVFHHKVSISKCPLQILTLCVTIRRVCDNTLCNKMLVPC